MAGQQKPGIGYIKLAEIRENPVALRAVNRKAETFRELIDSVKKEGVLNAINVREKAGEDGKKFEIIDGLHRYSAAVEAGLEEIPAQVITRSDAEALISQIIANVQKVETRPAEYADQLRRILSQNPTMTEAELATMLAKSPAWINDTLGLTKLNEAGQKLVNEGRIGLSNAYALSKLPVEEQDTWLERAATMPPAEFAPKAAARVKEIRDAARQGKAAQPEQFTPVMHLRKKSEIEAEVKAPTAVAELIRKNNITNAIEAAKIALAWVVNFDPESQAAQKAKHEQEMARQAEQKERRKKEQQEKRAQEAAAKEAADRKAVEDAKA